jgi:hypothetical protein
MLKPQKVKGCKLSGVGAGELSEAEARVKQKWAFKGFVSQSGSTTH